MDSGMKLVARRLQLAMRASASECQAGGMVLGRRTGVLRACPGGKVGLWEQWVLQEVRGRCPLGKDLDR